MQTHFALPAELTIYCTGELRTEWLTCLGEATAGAGGTPAEDYPVDASAVDQVDAAGLQLLLALARSLASRQRPLRLVQPSAVLTRACEDIGLAASLLPASATGGAGA